MLHVAATRLGLRQMSSPSFSIDDVRLITIHLDRAAYQQAGADQKAYFQHLLRGLEQNEWVTRGGKPVKEMMFIDLEALESFEDYIAQCRKIHKGNAIRDANKAARTGYYTKFFNSQNHLDDILAISLSSPERQGHRLSDHYFLTAEEQGGYPASIEAEPTLNGALAWYRYFGLFQRKPGHRQGHLPVDEELLAYGLLRRCGEFALITKFIGHAEHLRNGIMYKMHVDMIDTLLKQRDLARAGDETADRSLRGLRYLTNTRYFGQPAGLVQWKVRMLYRPGFFQYDFDLGALPAS